MVNDDIIKSCVGPNYRKFAPYLLTAFFFIFINNIMGLIPFFPGGANVTGNIAITMVLAICTFLAVNIFGTKHYWKDIFWPDVPWWLKVPVPMMPFIEFFGIFTKPFAFRQYAGGTHGDAGTDLPDLYLGKHGTCAQRYTDGSFRTVQHFYECA
jgi:F0F1-type ATP synthase membrane subunit a